MKLAPPLITLGVGAVLAGGLVVANVVNSSRAEETVTPAAAAAAATQPSAEAAPASETASPSETTSPSVTAAASVTPESITPESTTTPAPAPAPAVTWTYKGPIDGTELSAAISVTGDQAVAYVCDGELVEFWLYGTATNGTLDLAGAGGETIAATVTPELVGGNLHDGRRRMDHVGGVGRVAGLGTAGYRRPWSGVSAMTDSSIAAPTPARPAGAVTLLVLFAVGAAVAVGAGVYGTVHEPAGIAVNIAGFSGPMEVKVWLTTLAFVLGLVQLVSALVMYGRLPLAAGARWWGPVHRWSGRLAFLATVPVAIHCLYALGFQSYDTRVLAHSLLGCAFYGAFTVKMLGLSRPSMPGWFLPVLGGAVLTSLVGLWLTSALWFFTTFGIRF